MVVSSGTRRQREARKRARAEQRTSGGDDAARLPLRLIAARGGLGIELDEPRGFGPLGVSEMRWSLPGLSFPVDLSGGVRAFRHRRGQLERVQVTLSLEKLRRWLEPRLQNVLGGLRSAPSVWVVPGGLAVGMNASQGALAFDLLWVPEGERPRFVIARARSAGMDGPALGHAVHIVDTAVAHRGNRLGRLISFDSLPVWLVQSLLPELGFRSPAARGLELSDVEVRGDHLSITASQGASPWSPSSQSLHWLELALLTREADDALAAGQLVDARQAYLSALEKAPKHPEICQLVASIDVAHAERDEAALGLLTECLPAASFGLVGAQLLAKVGDFEGARAAVDEQAQREPFAPLAGMMWLRLAQLCDDLPERMELLDQGLAACVSSEPLRWARFQARVDARDVSGAIADAEHLEASARGSRERHERLVRAGQGLLSAGLLQPAGKLFERAMRYLPTDAHATLGLAESLLDGSRPERATTLLRRSIDLAEDDRSTRSRACLLLAKLLAHHYRDLPQAIARLREVSGTHQDAIEARALEGRYRASLGDLAGATVAYGSMKDAIELSHEVDHRRAADWLLSAAKHHQTAGEYLAATKQLAVALRLCPRDEQVRAAYRLAAEQLRALGAGPNTAD